MQRGHHARARSRAGSRGHRPEPFRYRDLGTMATIARFRAVVYRRPRAVRAVAWLMWLVVHLVFLTGFKNRLAAVANWAVAFLGPGPAPAHDHEAAGARADSRDRGIEDGHMKRGMGVLAEPAE